MEGRRSIQIPSIPFPMTDGKSFRYLRDERLLARLAFFSRSRVQLLDFAIAIVLRSNGRRASPGKMENPKRTDIT